MLTQEQIRYFDMPDSKGVLLNEPKYTWTQGIVYFDFIPGNRGNGQFSQYEKIRQAMNHYHQYTGVEFRHVTFKNPGIIYTDDAKRHQNIVQPNYVRFIDGEGCWSYLGRIGGKQELCLDPSWATVGNAIHELGHAVGLVHEHSRRDRDSYVNVIYSNIKPEWRYAYDIEERGQNKFSTFDFSSIMLYSCYNGFAINQSKPTLTKKNGSTWSAQRSYLAAQDIGIINLRYVNPPCKKVL